MTDFISLEDDATLRRALYAAAVLLLVVPFVQALSQLWPLNVSSIEWRYGAANALSSVLLLPFLGLTLLLFVGRAMESRGVSRTVGIISAIMAAGLAASLVLFALDSLQLKAIVRTPQMQGFMNASVRVAIVSVIFTVSFALLAIAGFKAPKRPSLAARRAPKAAEEPSAGVLIVGREFAKAE